MAPEGEPLAVTVHRLQSTSGGRDAELGATVVITRQQSDWKTAAATILTAVSAPAELQKSPMFLTAVATVVVASFSPLQLQLISDEAAELLKIIEVQARRRVVLFGQMQKILGGVKARAAIKALERAGLVRQESNGDWTIQRVRLTSFRVLP